MAETRAAPAPAAAATAATEESSRSKTATTATSRSNGPCGTWRLPRAQEPSSSSSTASRPRRPSSPSAAPVPAVNPFSCSAFRLSVLNHHMVTWRLSGSEFPAAAGDVVRFVEADLRKRAEDVVDRARSLCIANSVHALIEVIEGEPRYVLCNAVEKHRRRTDNAVEKHRADLLVVGSHGAIKRAFLGSVGDYCTHHTLLRRDSEAAEAQDMMCSHCRC